MFSIFAISILRWLWKWVLHMTFCFVVHRVCVWQSHLIFALFWRPGKLDGLQGLVGQPTTHGQRRCVGCCRCQQFQCCPSGKCSHSFLYAEFGTCTHFSNTAFLPCSENSSSVDCQRFPLNKKWIFVVPSWREPFASTVVLGVLLVLYLQIQHLRLSRWNRSAWRTWLWVKWQTSTEWTVPDDLDTRPFKKRELQKKLEKLERKTLLGKPIGSKLLGS